MFSVVSRDENLGPKSMKIYRWRFKNLIKYWIFIRNFICVKLVICTFLLNRYHRKLIENSYSNKKLFQISMVNCQSAKLWIILALKFSELPLQLVVYYRQNVQQIALQDNCLNKKVFCSGNSDFLFTRIISEYKSANSVLLILTRHDLFLCFCWFLKLLLEPSLFLRKIWQKKPKHHWKEVNKTLPHISPFKLVMKKQHLNWFHN